MMTVMIKDTIMMVRCVEFNFNDDVNYVIIKMFLIVSVYNFYGFTYLGGHALCVMPLLYGFCVALPSKKLDHVYRTVKPNTLREY